MKFVTRLIVCVIALSQVFKVSLHSYSSRELGPQILEGRGSTVE